VQHSVKLYGLAKMSEPRKRKEKNVNVKKENNMGHGIGPQNLGAAGMSAKSKPCGTPLDFVDPRMQMGMQQSQMGMQPQQMNIQQPMLQQPMGMSPVPFNDKLEKAVDEGKITGKFANIVKANS